jgi:uncharacterized Zn finger protein
MVCPSCGSLPWWDELAEIDDSGLAECENCGKMCQPVTTN